MHLPEKKNLFRRLPRSWNQKVGIIIGVFVSLTLINVLYYDSSYIKFNKIHTTISHNPSIGKIQESSLKINTKILNQTLNDYYNLTIVSKPSYNNNDKDKTSNLVEFNLTTTSTTPIIATTKKSDNEINEEMKCKLPQLQPFDSSILSLLALPEEIICFENPRFPLLFESDLNSSIILVSNREEDFGYDLTNCCYSNLVRDPDFEEAYDESYGLGEQCIEINSTITVIPDEIEHILVHCLNTTSNSMDALDVFTFIRKKREVEERIGIVDKSGATDLDYKFSDQYNVVLIGIDGVSHMNFLRTMPQTVDFLINNLSAIEMEGVAKVGENTFPNMIPALTGWTVDELKNECWKSVDDFFDNCDYIWDEFAKNGYITSYAEDAPTISTFSYLKKGFQNSPVDYFLQPMLLFGQRYIGHNLYLNAEICYGPRHSLQIMLNYVKQMANFMKPLNKRYFQYIWNNPLFHDALEMAASGDIFLQEALEDMMSQGHLNDTIIILMSDHGLRWGEIRSTYQGKIEERMPLSYFIFPPTFKEKYSRGIENLSKNRNRLSTHFDLHETLKDLADLRRIEPEALKNKEDILLKKSKLPRGISLFLPIPKRRSCEDAGIDRLWCICDSKEEVDVKSKKIIEAGNVIMNSINYLVSEYPNCSYLNLTRIVNAQKILLDQNMFKNEEDDEEVEDETTKKPRKKHKKTTTKSPSFVDEVYEITIKTQPGNGTFEGTILHMSNDEWKMEEIVRASLYGNQSWCVNDSKMKNFCYCL